MTTVCLTNKTNCPLARSLSYQLLHWKKMTKKILVIDDNSDLLDLLREALTGEGYEVNAYQVLIIFMSLCANQVRGWL